MESSEEPFMRCLSYALPKVGKAEVVLKSDNFISRSPHGNGVYTVERLGYFNLFLFA